ncbi:hypothetical protein [Cellulomonas rhizosphaerae]|uniref:PBP domain-containing protein n=1 Tax=Cellulomonas rhizosphaerae TaxID=2293719 RepID=A0A413RN07_9CELL|nr:hypothetical protein [Cellulomonas rhizosphaerae]RHA42683.1 hypothetical protein D1825_06925 [Cellulomonas rhizosphaerae]
MNGARVRRAGAWLTVVGVTATTLGSALLFATGSAAAEAGDDPVVEAVEGGSQVVQAWSDPSLVGERDRKDPDYATFAKLEVTVSQTRNLSHQGVTVDWKGARPTSTGRFATDYLQVMQCWGDEADGPEPQQCQWGAPNPSLSTLLGDRTGLRSLKRGEDPLQAYDAAHLVPPPITNPNLKAYTVPFTPVTGGSVTDVADYFTSTSSNEITAARTGGDGTGTANMEIQTSLEAPHLGCGETLKSGSPRACWLVVVPRGETDADGSFAEDSSTGSISGSPLSATAWSHRMVFPLQFAAIGSSCALGNAEQRLVGDELFSDAMTSWQSALCGTGTTYGYSQIGDGEARAQLLSSVTGASGLAVVNRPLAPEKERPIVYAPVSQTSLVVAYTIDRQYTLGSTLASRDGTAVEDLVLNARLVAKLLTQSYRADVPGGGSVKPLTDNPRSIVNDPEFVALNPEMAQFVHTAAPDGLMVGLGTSDAYAEVWRWIIADPFARSFLEGEPDEYGMRVNPVYEELDLTHDDTLDSFPKADLSTYRQDETVPAPGYGTLDLRPYTNDMADAAGRTQKANSGAKIVWDLNKVPPVFNTSGAQLPGQRFSLAITDLVSAQRFGLRTARLVNAAGQSLAASDETMQKAVDAMVDTAVPGVVATDPSARVRGAYPLTLVNYAGVSVCSTTADQRKDYAAFLDYAATTGQRVGETKGLLPRGYLPLEDAQVTATTDVAAGLTDEGAIAKTCGTGTPKPTATPTATPTPTPTATTPTTNPTSDPAPVAPPATTPDTPSPSATTTAPPVDPDTGEATPGEPRLTGGGPLGAARLGIAGSVGLGAACAVTGPLLMRRGRTLASREEMGGWTGDFV